MELKALAGLVTQEKHRLYNAAVQSGNPITKAQAYRRALANVHDSLEINENLDTFSRIVGREIMTPALEGKKAAAVERRESKERRRHKAKPHKSPTVERNVPAANQYITEIIQTGALIGEISEDMLKNISAEINREITELKDGGTTCLVLKDSLSARIAEALIKYEIAEARGWKSGVQTTRYGRIVFVRRTSILANNGLTSILSFPFGK